MSAFEPVRHPNSRPKFDTQGITPGEDVGGFDHEWTSKVTDKIIAWEAEHPSPPGMKWTWATEYDLEQNTASIVPNLVWEDR